DAVRPGGAVFRLEGEKAVEEVESLDAGVLHVPADGPNPGDRVTVGAVIGYLLQPGEAPPAGPAVPGVAGGGAPADPRPPAAPVGVSMAPPPAPAISPRARRLARRLGVDWSSLRGSGRAGRIRERDVAAAAGPAADCVIPFTPIRKTIAARM